MNKLFNKFVKIYQTAIFNGKESEFLQKSFDSILFTSHQGIMPKNITQKSITFNQILGYSSDKYFKLYFTDNRIYFDNSDDESNLNCDDSENASYKYKRFYNNMSIALRLNIIIPPQYDLFPKTFEELQNHETLSLNSNKEIVCNTLYNDILENERIFTRCSKFTMRDIRNIHTFFTETAVNFDMNIPLQRCIRVNYKSAKLYLTLIELSKHQENIRIITGIINKQLK